METERITKTITELLTRMGFAGDLAVVEPFRGVMSRFNVRFRGDAYILIGDGGSTLAALEHLVKRMLRKEEEVSAGLPAKAGATAEAPESGTKDDGLKFTLDINDYRIRLLEDLKQEVKAAAKKVRAFQKEVPLRAMSSFERRVVHLLLAEYPDIMTESMGRDPDRKVVIKPFG